MVRLGLVVAVSMSILASTAIAQEKPKVPTGPPPVFRTVTSIDKAMSELELAEIQTKFVAETVNEEVKKEGKVELRSKAIFKPVYVQVRTKLALASAEVFDAAGKKLSREDVPKRLTAGATVLVSADGKKVDTVYLSVITADTLVLVSPEYVKPAAPAGPSPIVPSPPKKP
jgi:hypothetical protein